MLVAIPILTNKLQGPECVPGPQGKCMSWLTSVQLHSLLLLQMLSSILLTGSLPSPNDPAVQGRTLSGNTVSGSATTMMQSAKNYMQNICMVVHKLWSYTSVYCNTCSLYVHFSVECLVYSISKQYKSSSFLGFVFCYVFYSIVCRSS